MRETSVRGKVREYLIMRGCKIIPIEQGDGWPDVIVVPNGRPCFFIEFKSTRKGHKTQGNQDAAIMSLRLRGKKVMVVRDLDEKFLSEVQDYL